MPLSLNLWQAAICLAAVAFVAALAWKSLVVLAPWRRAVAAALRSILVLLLLLAIFEVEWKRESDRLAVLFVLDYSDSISPDSKRWAQNYLKAASARMTSGDLAGLLVFGEDSYVEIAPSPRAVFAAQLDRISSLPSTAYTDIARAIRLALAIFPEGAQRRLVLMTDGEENLGNAREEAMGAAAGEVPIEVVPLEQAREGDVLIERMILPPSVPKDSAFDARLLVQSSEGGPARVRFYQNGNSLGQQDIDLKPGKNLLAFPRKIDQPGFHTFDARIEALGDSRPENNVASGFTLVQGPPRVLYLANPEDSRLSPVPRFLEREGIEVDLKARGGLPADLSGMQSYDCLVLDNVPADSFSQRQMRMVERYVHDLGGGLVMIGGRDSFGPGGYLKTPIEDALPVEMTIKDRRHFPSFAEVIVIDQSGSMGMTAPSGKEKIELAAEGAILAVELLNDQDYIGVNATDTQPKWVLPLQRAEDRQAIARNIATLRAGGGGIYVYSGLKEALDRISGVEAMVKHIILFADAQDCDQQEGCEDLAKEMAARNITLTSVGLGTPNDPHVPFLSRIAEITGGRLHITEDGDQVPRIFTKETLLAQRSYLIEEPFVPSPVSLGAMLRGIAWETAPQLLGYVGTTAKPRAEVLLSSHRDDPVLASWQYGLGKAVAFTSDAQPRWAKEWIAWDQFGKFWTQTIRWPIRTNTASHLQSQVEIRQGEGLLSVDAMDSEGEFLNFLQLRATVLSPSLERTELTLRQSSPGRYEGRFPARETGSYLVNVVDETPGSAEQGAQDVSGVAVSYPVEYRPSGKGPSLIKQLAETARGKILEGEDDLGGIFRHDLRARKTSLPIWPRLMTWFVLLLPFDIALRRITLTAEQWAWLGRKLQVWKLFAVRRTSAEDRTLTQLKEVKADLRSSEKIQPAEEKSEQARKLQAELRRAMDRKTPSIDLAPPVGQPGPEAKKETQPADQPAEGSSSAGYTQRLLDAKRRARSEGGDRNIRPDS